MIEPLISFVVPVRNDAGRLKRCLATIASSAGATPIEVVVADNGSTDGSADVAREAAATVMTLPGLRVAQLRNLAAAQSQSPLLAFVDADHALAPGWTMAALQAFEDPAVWAAGAEYFSPPDPTWVQRLYDALRSHAPGTTVTDWLPSGNLVARREAFRRLGGFDETLESCEDVDFCQRLRAAGGRLVSIDALRSIHYGDPKTLAELFFSELWRGRDNIRVSLRERLTLRSAPGLIVPVVNVLNIFVAALGLLLSPWGGWIYTVAAALLFASLASARALRIFLRVPGRRMLDLPAAWMVAATYDFARALALVFRAGHRVRRRG